MIALAGVGAGIGIVFGRLIQAASRNPTMAKALMGYALLGFALCESVRLFRLLVTFLILFGSIKWTIKEWVSSTPHPQNNRCGVVWWKYGRVV